VILPPLHSEEEGGEAVDEIELEQELVGVPDAVEEAFPDLDEDAVGECVSGGGGLEREPLHEEADSHQPPSRLR